MLPRVWDDRARLLAALGVPVPDFFAVLRVLPLAVILPTLLCLAALAVPGASRFLLVAPARLVARARPLLILPVEDAVPGALLLLRVAGPRVLTGG